MKSKITNTLHIGLLSILTLVAVATWFSLDRMGFSNNKSHQVIEKQHQQMMLMLSLQTAIRNRQISLRNLFLINDPFDYDEEVIQFSNYARDFIRARNELTKFNLTENEKTELDTLLNLTRKAQPKQSITADLLLAGDRKEAINILFTEGLPLQDKVINQLDIMVGARQAATSKATVASLNNYIKTKQHIFIIYILCFSLVGTIVIIIIKRTNTLEHIILVTNRRLELLANKDGLTGLSNRRQFNKTIEADWQLCSRVKSPLSIIMIDIDNFKLYNDTFGHIMGDDVLRQIGKILASTASRHTDLAARYGGEEFVMVLPSTPIHDAIDIAENIRTSIEDLKIKHISPFGLITASLGVASKVPSAEDDHLSIIRAADNALYRAKNHGRNHVVISSNQSSSLTSPI